MTSKSNGSIKKDSERKTYENIMKRVNTKVSANTSSVDEDKGITSRVAVNTKNVLFLDKILSKKCKKCNSIKPPHSHHCSICKHCIAHMDHHCPWVNNCVGYYTQKHFILFLIYVFNGSSHALYLMAKNSLYCLDKNCALFSSVYVIVVSKFFICIILI